MYKFKDAAKRVSAVLGAAGLLAGVGASAIPAFTSADALNPLTDRSLTLSSSSPGWAYTDGSGNSTYAGPGTGTNGQITGNTFSFRTSSDATVQAFTFQYCTQPAGDCTSPGDDAVAGTDTASTSDLDIHTDTPSEVSGSDYANLSDDIGTGVDGAPVDGATATGAGTGGDSTANLYGNVNEIPDGQDTVSPYQGDGAYDWDTQSVNGIAGNFVVLYSSTGDASAVDTYSGGWTMTAANQEEGTGGTGLPNMITLTNSTGAALPAGALVKVYFFATSENYITNPGAGAFFVKINDYSSSDYQVWDSGVTYSPSYDNECVTTGGSDWDSSTGTNPCGPDVIDGGVTVANVMNQSIQIETKVLETMDFSVGVVDPDTLDDAELTTASGGAYSTHGPCEDILPSMDPTKDAPNVLTMGNQDSENSLSTSITFATHSYWRLSSNSSGGATVYYAGNTLSDTEGDQISPIENAGQTGVMAVPQTGAPQFGLALDTDEDSPDYTVNYSVAGTVGSGANTVQTEYGADQTAASGGTATDAIGNGSGGDTWADEIALQSSGVDVHQPMLKPMIPATNYGSGEGPINTSPTAEFAFDPDSQTIPTPIASESTAVVDCVTGKMRYIANIAATTPAGIYTTKINYIAAPQY